MSEEQQQQDTPQSVESSSTTPVIQYDDQIDDASYKHRDQKSKWTRARTGDRSNDKKRARREIAQERRKNEYEQKNSTPYVPRLDENGQPIPKSERKPKKKCAVMIGYCGTGYNGMQLQNDPAIKTIERDIYEAMARAGAISPENADDIKKSGFMRAARTDKGVHAAGNVISLKMIIEDPDIKDKINAELPDQIRIWGIQRTTKSFDCRKLCSSRVYEYLLPTYSLLPPKPTTVMAELVKSKRALNPDLFHPDPEGEAWWAATNQKILDAGISQSQLDSIGTAIESELPGSSTATPTPTPTIDPESGELTTYGKALKSIKQIETQSRRAYRIPNHRLSQFRSAMEQYQGTHNFHNFTIGKSFKDQLAQRYIISTKVSDPFVIEGTDTEWISIRIHGQSFMLHQIRKMVSMASMVVRIGCPVEIIQDFFNKEKINIPKAPALGLLLENPVFDAYNQMLTKLEYDPIEFGKYDEEMEKFKMKFIYDKIYAEEAKENVFYGFFGFVDTRSLGGNGNTNTVDSEGERSEGTSVFDFLLNYTKRKEQEAAAETAAKQENKDD